MHPHTALISAIASQHGRDLLERGEHERYAAQAQAPEQVGTSYRLGDGSWLHARHDSA